MVLEPVHCPECESATWSNMVNAARKQRTLSYVDSQDGRLSQRRLLERSQTTKRATWRWMACRDTAQLLKISRLQWLRHWKVAAARTSEQNATETERTANQGCHGRAGPGSWDAWDVALWVAASTLVVARDWPSNRQISVRAGMHEDAGLKQLRFFSAVLDWAVYDSWGAYLRLLDATAYRGQSKYSRDWAQAFDTHNSDQNQRLAWKQSVLRIKEMHRDWTVHQPLWIRTGSLASAQHV